MGSTTDTGVVLGWPWTFRWPGTADATQAFFGFAPERLWQPVNPGWTFGNVVVNAANSSAPDVEQRVVSRHSYGRQIGRTIDAVMALAEALPDLADDPRMQAFVSLAQDVERVKQEAARTRLEQLREELRALKESDPEGYRELMRASNK